MNMYTVGRFELCWSRIKYDPYTIAKLLGQLKFIPLKVESLFPYHSDTINYMGISDKFREMKEGEPIPKYVLTLHTDEKEKINLVGVEEIK